MASLDIDAVGRERLRAYRFIEPIGKGGFAEVDKWEQVATHRIVAIKRIMKAEYRGGVNLGAIKELQALQELHHRNILNLLDVFSYGDRVHLVLEYAACDLTAVIRDRRIKLTEAHVKGYIQQILAGVEFMHARHFLHRDLKPDNVLLLGDGTVKVADFGHAARFPEPEVPLFPRVVTLWYRAPELLFGAYSYGPPVDMWAVGCILAELLLRQPIFPGAATETDQLAEIIRIMGSPVDPLPRLVLPTGGAGSGGGGGDDATAAAAPVPPATGAAKPPALSIASVVAAEAAAAAAAADVVAAADGGAAAGASATAAAVTADTGFRHTGTGAAAGGGAASASASAAVAAAVAAVAPAGDWAFAAAAPLPAATASGTASMLAPSQRGRLWPGVSALPAYCEFEFREAQPWRAVFPPGAVSDLALDLVASLLRYDPTMRLTAADALKHPWFTTAPLPEPSARLPVLRRR